MNKSNIIYTLCLLGCVFACALPFLRADKDVSFVTLQKEIHELANSQELKEEDRSYIRKQFELNDSDYQNAICFGPISAMEVNTLMAVECTSEQKEYIQKQMKNKVDKQYKSFANYAPRQANLLKDAHIFEKGDYIFLIIHKNDQVLQSKIESLF